MTRLDRRELLRTLWPQTKLPFRMDPKYRAALVSVIVPAYNRAGLIRRCLESVARQSYRPIELLVVDDGSTDATSEVVGDFARRADGDSLVVRYLKQDNEGAPAARNRGLVESRGEFIQFLDSDDVLHPKKLELHVLAITAIPECGFVWSEHGEFEIGTDPGFSDYDPAALLQTGTAPFEAGIFGTTGHVWAGLYRRSECLATGPWNEALKRWQDIEYNIRFTSLAPKCRFISANLVGQGKHSMERISDLYEKADGIEAGLTTLRYVEKTLDAFQEPQGTYARNSVATFYLGLAKLAMRHRAEACFRQALQGARRNRGNGSFHARLDLLELAHGCFGPRLAGAILATYSRVRLAAHGTGPNTQIGPRAGDEECDGTSSLPHCLR